MNDALSLLWPHVDDVEPLFSQYALAPWSTVALQHLVDSGLLCRAANAAAVRCPACGDGHVEDVIAWQGPDGAMQYFIPCPETLRVRIAPDLLRQWTIDFDALACTVAASLALTGRCTWLVPARLWRLGRTRWRGALRDVVFARGLGWRDGRDVDRTIAHATRAVVLVADRAVPAELWSGRAPPVIALSQVAALDAGAISVDHDAVQAALLAADESARPTTIDVRQLKTMIRRQVKAEDKSQLSDDLLLAAYRQEGSVRKAAALLSRRTGQVVTKDKVQAAVARAGGVARGDDSGSVVRTVVSRRRDSSKKLLQRTQHEGSQ